MAEMISKEKSILLAVSACHALIHAYMLVFPTIYKSIGTSLKLEFAGVGFVGMASYMAFGFGSLPAGFLSDRLGARMLLVICLSGTTLASVVAFTATTPAGVVIALVLLGLFASMYHPAGLSLLSTTLKDLGKGMGIHGMGGMIGVAAAPVVAGSITARYGWTYSYLVLGGVGALLLVVLVAGLGFHKRGRIIPREETTHQERPRSMGRKLLFIYLIGAVYGLIYRGIMTFFPSYLSQRVPFIGDDVGRLGLVTSGILVISIVGPLVGGYLASSPRRTERNLLSVFILLGLLATGFYFASGLVLILVAVPAVLLIFGFQPLQNTLIAKSSHAVKRGTVYGINYTVAFGIGAFASGIGGVFGERFGLPSIFLLMLGLCLIEIILVTASGSVRERSEQDGVSQP
jgi:MFS family permease